MRRAGRISGWNDDKGFGFVVPHEGGERAFVHIKAFAYGSRRPVDGDLISYAVASDARGRPNAAEVRFAGQRIATRTPPAPLPRTLIGSGFLLAVVVGAGLGAVPAVIPLAYAGMSALSFVLYTWDKAAAGKGRQRTPENTLHLADLLGGWPGALIAQQRSRHKTVKASFQWVFWLTVVVNLAALAWLVRSGVAQSPAQSLLGR